MDDHSKLIFSNVEHTNKKVACLYEGAQTFGGEKKQADVFFRVIIY